MNAYELPDEVFQLSDDSTVERILLQLGVRERFEFPPDVKSNSFFYTMDDHPTHWLLASRFRDYPNPADNGFMLFGWPKRLVSAQEAKKAAAKIVGDAGLFTPERTFIYNGKKG